MAMPMEPNRTRQIMQDLARAFNKLASELTADLSYAAREIDSLRKEVQRLRASPSKSSRTNGSSKKSAASGTNTTGKSHKRNIAQEGTTQSLQICEEDASPTQEHGYVVFSPESCQPWHGTH